MEPRLRDALDMLFGPQRFSAQHAASILRADAAKLTAALDVMRKAGLVEVTNRGEPGEAWHSTVDGGDVAALVARVEAGAVDPRLLDTQVS